MSQQTAHHVRLSKKMDRRFKESREEMDRGFKETRELIDRVGKKVDALVSIAIRRNGHGRKEK